MHFSKSPLELTRYGDYSIDQTYSAYIYEYLNITEIDADNIESKLVSDSFKIFHSNLTRSHENMFNLKIIIAKLSYTF